jgi:uncharacterized repeat protein (TIGR02543 family)
MVTLYKKIGGYTMNKMKNIIFAFIMSMLMLMIGYGSFVIKANAASTSNEKYEYVIKNKEVTIVKYIGNEKHISVPSKLESYPVTKIKEFAFSNLEVLTIYIPSSVKTIEGTIIGSCEQLTGVIIGNGVEKISDSIAMWCPKLKYIVLGTNVNKISGDILNKRAENKTILSIPNLYVSGYDFWSNSGNTTICLAKNSPLYKKLTESYQSFHLNTSNNYINIKFMSGNSTKANVKRVMEGTIINELFALENTSKKAFVGWYTSEDFKEKVEKVENANGENLVLYAKFIDKIDAPKVIVSKISDTKYNLKWNKTKGYFYQVEVRYATHKDSTFSILQKYKENIGSYDASVLGNYDCMFRVKAYTLVDGVKVYSNYSDIVYYKKPTYPLIYVNRFDLRMNSVGGVDNYITYINNSDKTIKYIVFNITPYNAVNDKISCSIARRSSFRLQDVGPIKKNQKGGGYWEAVWYNSTTKFAKMTSIEIEYTDGTKKTTKVNLKGTFDY